MNGTVVPMQDHDWEQVRNIFAEGIATGMATLETEPPTWERWDASHLKSCRLVYRQSEGILAWAALTAVSSRCVYSGVAEVSVYVSPEHWGKGIGLALLQALIAASEAAGVWTLQAHIISENLPSLALHAKAGFREVGRRERLGQLHGKWKDIVLLERRSRVVGVE